MSSSLEKVEVKSLQLPVESDTTTTTAQMIDENNEKLTVKQPLLSPTMNGTNATITTITNSRITDENNNSSKNDTKINIIKSNELHDHGKINSNGMDRNENAALLVEKNNNINVDMKDDDNNPDDTKGNKKKSKKSTHPVIPFSQLFRFASSFDWFLIAIGSLAAIANGVALPFMTLIFGELIQTYLNYLITKDQTKLNDDVIEGTLYLTGLGIGIWIVGYIQMSFWMWAGENQAKRVRERFFRSILRQEIGWFDKTETGDLTSRLIGDIGVFQDGVGEKVSFVIQFVCTFLAGFVIAFVKGWKLALVLTACLPLLGGSGAFMSILLAAGSSKGQDAYAEAGGIAQQVFSSVRTVVAFNGQERESKRYSKKLLLAEKEGIKNSLIAAIGLGVVWILVFSCYSLAFWYGSILIYNNEMNGGDVLNVFFAFVIGAFSLGNASPNAAAIATAKGVAPKIFEIIDKQSAIDAMMETGEKPEKVKGDIEFKNIKFSYPQRSDVTVLKNFSLKIEAGQSVALVGASGSGKSTIVKLLERFYDPTSGVVTFDGKNICSLNIPWLRHQIGIVSQEPALFDTTIRENILYGYPFDTSKLSKEEIDAMIKLACEKANAWSFIQALPNGVDTNVGEAGSMISGGQKQRIAIARAIIKNPPILLLDEATSALDTESERIVQAALDSASKGRTTITVAHRLSTIKDANQIIVMSQGEIIENGTHNELLERRGAYDALVQAQSLSTEIKNASEPDVGKTEANKERLKSEAGLSKGTSVIAVQDGANNKGEQKGGQANESSPMQTSSKNVGVLRILKFNAPEWHLFSIGTIAAVGNGVIMPVFSIIFSKILTIFGESDKDKMREGANFWALFFFILGIISFFSNFLTVATFGICGEKLTTRIRKYFFESLLRQEIGFYDDPEHASGILTSRLADDASQIQGLTGKLLSSILQALATLVAGLTIAFVNDWRLTLVTLSVLPAMIIGGAIQMKSLSGFGGESKKAYNEAGQIACEAIINIRTVATLSKEQHFYEKYLQRIQAPHQLTLKGAFVASIGFGFGQGIMFFAYAIAFYYGSRVLIWEFYPDPVDGVNRVFQVMFAIVFTAMAAGQASTFAPNVAKAKIAAASIFDILDRKSLIDVNGDDGHKPQRETVVGKAQIVKGEFSYPSRPNIPVLKGLHMVANPGQTVALVGASGCGKSTVIGLMERFYELTEGVASLDDIDIEKWHLRTLRSNIALVGQEPILFNISIKENILYGASNGIAADEEIESAARMANIHDFIMSLPHKYNTIVGEKGGQLSGGQKQRIAIARALISNPKLLLLDEATSALDSESEKVVQEALDKAAKGRTTIVIAHRLSTIQKADLICVVKLGVIAEQGTHDELIAKKGLYYELVMQQSLGQQH